MEQEELDRLIKEDYTDPLNKYPNHFVLTWEGTKNPEGAIINDHKITWTQGGAVWGAPESETQGDLVPGEKEITVGDHTVIIAASKKIGEYVRLRTGGETGRQHVMLIGTHGTEVTFPNSAVQKVVLRPGDRTLQAEARQTHG